MNTPVMSLKSSEGEKCPRCGRALPCFVLVYLGYLVFLIFSAPFLPERVASHFGAEGRANGWMSRPAYLLFTGTFPLCLTGLFLGVGRLVRRLPAAYINIPRKDYWLAPERRAMTEFLIQNRLAGLACLLTLFFGGLHGLTVVANRVTPARLPMDGFIVLLIAFLLSVMVWMAMLLMRLAEVDGERKSAGALDIPPRCPRAPG